ncbi:MAG: type IX secretion system sortase PorU [Candidatus Cloacimonetes bacterium]|nr:type IX secretion system sortase PorU [Candidatus Cloacimonadota bacterium]
MKRTISLGILLLTVVLLPASIRVLDKSVNELTVEFLLDRYELQDVGDYIRLMIPEANYPTSSGAPSLPSLEFKIGIPPDGDVSYTILSTSQKELTLDKRIQPVPYLESGQTVSEYRYEIDEAQYNRANEPLLKSLGTYLFRSHPFIPILINPVDYDGHNNLRLTTSALIRISIKGNLESKTPAPQDSFTEGILQQLLNAEDARFWQEQKRVVINHANFSDSPWWLRIETDKKGMYRINPSQLSGFPISEIDPRSFRLFTSTGKPIPFQATSSGNGFQEVPIQVVGEADGSFDSGDYIVFYGSDRTGWDHNNGIQQVNDFLYHNPYSNNYVYWLSFAGSFSEEPRRIQEYNTPVVYDQEYTTHSEIVHIEQEAHRREQTGYVWYMTRMFGSSTLDYSFDVNLPDLEPGSTSSLQLRMRQEDIESSQTHSISVWVNDVLIPANGNNPDVHTWPSTSLFNFNKQSSAFVPGSNRVKIRVFRNNTQRNLFLDYYRVTYTKQLNKGNNQYAVNSNSSLPGRYIFTGASDGITVFQVTNDYTVNILPHQTSGNGFSFSNPEGSNLKFYIAKADELYSPASIQRLSPTDLTQIDSPIQNLIVTPADFMDQAQQLAQMYNQNWGITSKIALQEDIMTQFNGGHPDPAAIRQYVRYLFHYAPEPKIQSLTLLGLGTLDWRNYSGEAASLNKIMIYQSPDSLLPNVSDDYFAMITTNQYPELAIGRYPVSNSSEISIMLSNFQNYTQNPKPGLWRNSMVFLADDYVNGDTTNDDVHTKDMQELASLMNPSVYNAKIFAEEYDYDQFLNKPKVRDELFRQINLGKLIFYYVGHGSFDALGMQNYFTGATDMGRFQNPDMLPLFIAASCEVSSFDHWAYESLGQKSVLLNNRGAIASVGATRKSFPDPNMRLMTFFLKNMVNFRNPVGYALANAKFRHSQSETNDEMYVILGDPLLRIIPPERDSTMIMKVDGDDNALTIHSRQIARLQGSFSDSGLNGEATLFAYDADREYQVRNENVSQKGTRIFNGKVSVQDSDFTGGFFVPDDVQSGETGLVAAYFWDEQNKTDYVSYYHPLSISDDVLPGTPENDGAPEISIYLGSLDYREGDKVSTSPMLYARIKDENGINVTGSAGHNIILVLDNSPQPISVTDYFSHDTDSFTTGTLVYPLKDLSVGPHTVQVIAFDNFNLPAVQSTSFIAQSSAAISLENLLIYPNPIKTEGQITFLIDDNSDLTVDVFTMSGRRIRRIETHVQPGFQSIPFDGKDDFGDRLANNTYFIRVRAKNDNGDTVEKVEKMVIYK